MGILKSEKIATALRRPVAALDKQIEHKRRPMFEGQNITRRRADMQESSRRDADRLEKVKNALLALADLWEAGEVPVVIQKVTSKALVEVLLVCGGVPSYDPERKRYLAAGLDTDQKAKEAHEALKALVDKPPDPELERQRKLERMITEARMFTGNGFFWTPHPVADRVLELANIYAGLRVLEPSAGLGDLIDPLQYKEDIDLEVIEFNYSRREILKLKGYEVVGHDFMEHEGQYDRIIMNPPFENLNDIDHLRHAWDCLALGGRVVCIMSESPFFRSDKKAQDFRDWLQDVDGRSEKLPKDAFKEAGTQVQARVVIISQPSPIAS